MMETPMWDDDDDFLPHHPQTTCPANGKELQEFCLSIKKEGQKLGIVAVNHDKKKRKTN